CIVFTPSDYGLGAEIGYKELDRFFEEKINGKKRQELIDGLYRLSSLQQGMLFHGLYDGEGGSYITQFSCELLKADVDVVIKAWNQVLNGHTILRTAFYNDVFSDPAQCGYTEAQMP